MFRRKPESIIESINQGNSWSHLGQGVSELRGFLDGLLGEDDGKGAYSIRPDDAAGVKDIGVAIFSKAFKNTESIAFSHVSSLPILQNTVYELARVGLVHEVIEELGSDTSYTPGGGRTLARQIANSKSGAGNFFKMIEDVKFTEDDYGMQRVLEDYSKALEVVAHEGATDADHRPTAGLRIFSDILPDKLKDSLEGIGPEHAQNTFARALLVSNLVSETPLEVPDDLAGLYHDHVGFINESNAGYHASILMAASVTAAPDFMAHAADEADRAKMAGQYLEALDRVLSVADEQGWDGLASEVYPEAEDAQRALGDDIDRLLEIIPEQALCDKSEIVRRLEGFISSGSHSAGIELGGHRDSSFVVG